MSKKVVKKIVKYAHPSQDTNWVTDKNVVDISQSNTIAGAPQLVFDIKPTIDIGDVTSAGGAGGAGGNGGTLSASVGNVSIGNAYVDASSGGAVGGEAQGHGGDGRSNGGNASANGGYGGAAYNALIAGLAATGAAGAAHAQGGEASSGLASGGDVTTGNATSGNVTANPTSGSAHTGSASNGYSETGDSNGGDASASFNTINVGAGSTITNPKFLPTGGEGGLTGAVTNDVDSGYAVSGIASNPEDVQSGTPESGEISYSSNGHSEVWATNPGVAVGGASANAYAGDALNNFAITGGSANGGIANVTSIATGGAGYGGNASAVSLGGTAIAEQNGQIHDLAHHLVETQAGGEGANGAASDVEFNQDIALIVEPYLNLPVTQSNDSNLPDAVATPGIKGWVEDVNTYQATQSNTIANGPQLAFVVAPKISVGDVTSVGGAGGAGGNGGSLAAGIGNVSIGGAGATSISGDAHGGKANAQGGDTSNTLGTTSANAGGGGAASNSLTAGAAGTGAGGSAWGTGGAAFAGGADAGNSVTGAAKSGAVTASPQTGDVTSGYASNGGSVTGAATGGDATVIGNDLDANTGGSIETPVFDANAGDAAASISLLDINIPLPVTGGIANDIDSGNVQGGAATNKDDVKSGSATSADLTGVSNATTLTDAYSTGYAQGGASGVAYAGDAVNNATITGGNGNGNVATAVGTSLGGEAYGGESWAKSEGGPAHAYQNGEIKDLVTNLVYDQSGGEGGEGGYSDVDFNQEIVLSVSPRIDMPINQTNVSNLIDATASLASVGHIKDINEYKVTQANAISGGPQMLFSVSPTVSVGDVLSVGGEGGAGGNGGSLSANVGGAAIGSAEAISNSGYAGGGDTSASGGEANGNVGDVSANGGHGGAAGSALTSGAAYTGAGGDASATGGASGTNSGSAGGNSTTGDAESGSVTANPSAGGASTGPAYNGDSRTGDSTGGDAHVDENTLTATGESGEPAGPQPITLSGEFGIDGPSIDLPIIGEVGLDFTLPVSVSGELQPDGSFTATGNATLDVPVLDDPTFPVTVSGQVDENGNVTAAFDLIVDLPSPFPDINVPDIALTGTLNDDGSITLSGAAVDGPAFDIGAVDLTGSVGDDGVEPPAGGTIPDALFEANAGNGSLTGLVHNTVTSGSAASADAFNTKPVVSADSTSGSAHDAGNGLSVTHALNNAEAYGATSGVADGGEATNSAPIDGGDALGGYATVLSTGYGGLGDGGIATGYSHGGYADAYQNGDIYALLHDLTPTQEGADGGLGGDSNVDFNHDIAFTLDPHVYMPFNQSNNSQLIDAPAIEGHHGWDHDWGHGHGDGAPV